MAKVIRIFKDCAGALLLGAATVLFVSNWTGALPDAVPPREPVFLIPVPDLFWIAGGLALAMALGCLLFDRLFFQMLGLAWLTSCFLAYRVGLFFSGAHTLGGYLGDVSRAFGIAPAAAGFMADALLVCLLLSSVFFAVWLWQHEEPIPAKTDLKTVCPACGGHIAFAAVLVGQQIACPHCGKAVTLRRPELLKMTCVLCGGHIEFPAHALGQKISCPHCRKTITLLNPAPPGQTPAPGGGFTLVELLVVIAILAILAAWLLPALSRAKEKGRQAVCQNNLHQMAIGFQVYWQENHDEFPAPGSRTEYGPQPEDWIWWEQDRDVKRSAIAREMAGFDPKVFTCPSDGQALRLQGQGLLPDDPYRYSYSLTSYSLTADKVNPGMSTIITRAREGYPFKSSQIRRPVAKIMLVEEDRKTINDSRWLPVANSGTAGVVYNLIASRHGQKGDVLFADAHLEAVRPEFGRDPANSVPGY